ncbi:MAG: hypothetical protein OXQ92_10485 [Boseongicola sp.]|nr:hypothetical protein [Boseongicola sp.]MDD9977664.1 hypothetical protein [Boseongicola sp.]
MRSVLALIFALIASGLSAEPTKLSANEITALLLDRTAVGEWAGTPYRQHFASDGTTIYAAKGQRSSRGKWRVNTDTNAYESWWERSGWDAYDVVVEDEVFYWVDSAGEHFAFTMVDGQQLVFED